MSNTRSGRTHAFDFVLSDMHRVGIPNIWTDPAQVFHVLNGAPTEALTTELFLVLGLGEVSVQGHIDVASHRC